MEQHQEQPNHQQRHPQQQEDDPVIGLDVCGQVYFCHQSTLTNISPYFAGRFKGNFNAGLAYVDQHGRNVYFVERCPLSFPYIFRYMISPTSAAALPDFDHDKALIRSLRQEAEFFGLVGLCEMLQVTRSFSPHDSGNQGVLYWLGTQKGAAQHYKNPYSLGLVHVGGWVDDPTNQHESMFELAKSHRSRANFVQYHQPVTLVKRGINARVSIESFNYLLWCDHGREELPVVIDLKSVLLRPTHYSLRVSQCYGMAGDWNLEGSMDNVVWDILHKARSDQHLCLSGGSDIISQLDKFTGEAATDEQRAEAVLGLLEQDYRHTWELSTPPTTRQFYRYFRIIGAGHESDSTSRDTCLHGEGIELYGDVYED